MGKTVLFTDATGVITPALGTVVVPDFDTPMGILVFFSRQDDKVLLVRQNTAANGWDPVTDDLGEVWLSRDRSGITITMPDTYALQGKVEGSLSAVKVA